MSGRERACAWLALVWRVRRIAAGHPDGAGGVLARAEMERQLRDGAWIMAARARDPRLFEIFRELAWDWTRRVEDEARARLTGPLLAVCDALLAAGREAATTNWMMAG